MSKYTVNWLFFVWASIGSILMPKRELGISNWELGFKTQSSFQFIKSLSPNS